MKPKHHTDIEIDVPVSKEQKWVIDTLSKDHLSKYEMDEIFLENY